MSRPPFTASPPRAAYRVNEFASTLGVSRAHVYNLISRGEIRAVKIGNSTRVPATELQRLLNEGAAS